MTPNFIRIGQRIKKFRKAKQLSQAELAELIDMSVPYISHIETATKQASLTALVRIASVLEITIDDLLGNIRSDDSNVCYSEFIRIIDDCSQYEKHIIYEVIFVIKESIRDDKYLQKLSKY